MQHTKLIKLSLGTAEPISADGRRALDRREISLRWLTGTFLVGLTSCALMGYALLAAFEGRQQLGIPAEALVTGRKVPHQISERGERIVQSKIALRPVDRTIIRAPIVVREGNTDLVRPESFSLVRMPLGSNFKVQEAYPPFDPLEIFANEGANVLPETGMSAIYSSDLVSEISLRTTPFPKTDAEFSVVDEMSVEEIEQEIRSNGALLSSLASNRDNRYRVDPLRFADASEISTDITGGLFAKVLEENVTTTIAENDKSAFSEFEDDVITSNRRQRISSTIEARGYDTAAAADVEKALSANTGDDELNEGQALRIGILRSGDTARIVRFSLYQNARHVLTLAVNDRQRLVSGVEPPMNEDIFAALNEQAPPTLPTGEQPTVYDGIYRAALSYGMTKTMIAQVMRLVAANVDLQAKAKPTDRLEAFFSAADQEGKATAASELLYLRTRFGDVSKSIYRFQDPATRLVEYYDSEGKGVRPLLLRRPVPNARLTSNFGNRVDPILGYMRRHSGTDLAAPQGTPIMAAGDGVIESAGWSSSYGNHTVIRHSNGYATSYSHQSAIAKGIEAGTEIRQGQIIGFVGSTGRSTGSHLHYEMTVNGTRVDSMRTKLPQVGNLAGDAFAQFVSGKKRIEQLLNAEGEPSPAPVTKLR
ncbi:M23 family metallopeptidase [Ochrobactrum sp. XJ1]|nr:M23 family metallopeptidase [Ochrobactrum sp. XJ1]